MHAWVIRTNDISLLEFDNYEYLTKQKEVARI